MPCVLAEATPYLAMMATPEAIAALVRAADTVPPGEKQDYLYTRRRFGLLLVGNPLLLQQQILKCQPHADLRTYAYGIAGSGAANARFLLQGLAKLPNPRIQDAAKLALAHSWQAGGSADGGRKTGFWEKVKKNLQLIQFCQWFCSMVTDSLAGEFSLTGNPDLL